MPPLVACHTHSYGPFGARAAIERVRDAGIDAIELPIRTAGYRTRWGDAALVSTDSTAADLLAAERLLGAHGVRVASCTCLADHPLDADYAPLVRRKLDLAAHFGASAAVIDAGVATSDEDRSAICGVLRDLGDYAERRGLWLCCETQRGLGQDHRELLQTIRETGHPRVRANFDTGNLLYYNARVNSEVALAKCCHIVRHVRLKDSRGVPGEWHASALGDGGAVPFLRVYQLLRDCGFRGPYSICTEGIDGEPDPTLDERHQRVVDSMAYLRSIGFFD